MIAIVLGCCGPAGEPLIAQSIVIGWGLLAVSALLALMGVVATVRSRRLLAAGILGMAFPMHAGWWLAEELGCGEQHLVWSVTSTLAITMIAIGPWFCSFDGRWSVRNMVTLVALYIAALLFEGQPQARLLGGIPSIIMFGPLVFAGWSLLRQRHRRWWVQLLGIPVCLWLGLALYGSSRSFVLSLQSEGVSTLTHPRAIVESARKDWP